MLKVLLPHDKSCAHLKEDMHKLRKHIFKDRLGWDVTIKNNMEFDQFDTKETCYIVIEDEETHKVKACARLSPTMKPYLLGDVFPQLIEGQPVIRSHSIWEISRFAVDDRDVTKDATALLIAGILEFGIELNLTHYISMSDIRIEPIMRRVGWNPSRLGGTIDTGTDIAAGEIFDVNMEALNNVRSKINDVSSSLLDNSKFIKEWIN